MHQRVRITNLAISLLFRNKPKKFDFVHLFFAGRCAWAENKHHLRVTACDRTINLTSSPLLKKKSGGGGSLCMRLHLVKKDIYAHDPGCFASRHATGWWNFTIISGPAVALKALHLPPSLSTYRKPLVIVSEAKLRNPMAPLIWLDSFSLP